MGGALDQIYISVPHEHDSNYDSVLIPTRKRFPWHLLGLPDDQVAEGFAEEGGEERV